MTDNPRDGWLPFKEARAFMRRLKKPADIPSTETEIEKSG